MSETIALVGGPRDGLSMEWRGGDTLELPIYEMLPVPVAFDAAAKNEPVAYETALYVRSRRNRHCFVFQP